MSQPVSGLVHNLIQEAGTDQRLYTHLQIWPCLLRHYSTSKTGNMHMQMSCLIGEMCLSEELADL